MSYDGYGNLTSGYNFTASQSRSLTWTAYNKPRSISQGSTTLTFHYGADRARFKQVNSNGLTTIYVGGLFEVQTDGSTTTYVHYINNDATTVAIYKSISDNSEEMRYLHRDHLGSITAITDDSASIVEQLSYDAWGKRRNTDWTDPTSQLYSYQTTRGFTNHEMLDDVGLIHMNGRVYDPDLGRFLSADPTVQFPDVPQDLNRYSYVLNNPLSLTDPSGFAFDISFTIFGFPVYPATPEGTFIFAVMEFIDLAFFSNFDEIGFDPNFPRIGRSRGVPASRSVAFNGGPNDLMRLADATSGDQKLPKIGPDGNIIRFALDSDRILVNKILSPVFNYLLSSANAAERIRVTQRTINGGVDVILSKEMTIDQSIQISNLISNNLDILGGLLPSSGHVEISVVNTMPSDCDGALGCTFPTLIGSDILINSSTLRRPLNEPDAVLLHEFYHANDELHNRNDSELRAYRFELNLIYSGRLKVSRKFLKDIRRRVIMKDF